MKWDVTSSQRIRIVGAALLLVGCVWGAYILSWESRTAILSCGDCGNIRVIQVRARWWRIESVGIADGNEFVVPLKHVHRWWQYDSRRMNAVQRSGWSRQKYEDGRLEWSGEIDRSKSESGTKQLTEDWLHVIK